MTRDEALVVLGVEPQAEAAEVDSAYRRLMRTVHPDICSGPEAGRLARQAAVARGVLREQSQPSLPPARSAEHRSKPQSAWPVSGYPLGVVDDVHLARIVVAVVEVVGGCLSRDEVVGAVVGAVEWGGVAPAVRRAAVERLRHRDFWGFGQRSGLWKLRGRDIVLPHGQYTPGFRARAPRSGPNGSEPPLAPPPGRVWWISVALLLGACAVFLVLSAFEAELRSRSSAPVAGLASLPRWTGLAFALDPDLVDLVAALPYGCAGLVGASASVVSVGVEQPLEVCGFSASTRVWERVTDDVDLRVDSTGLGTVVVFLGDGRLQAVAPGRVEVSARYGPLSTFLKLQVLP